ncbi:hypothetical protein F8388_026101 [Cannabis sativa]|uniref:RNase H type-1 domain-containing protein n=1 Tax=Cannabis sativa TaxID=3483 RepID=A0A7J6FZX7_CANSA|nr:hypothetical protein F8388_026101 [Cannabis sativa]
MDGTGEIWKERNRRFIGEKEADILRITDLISLKIKDHLVVSSKNLPEVLSWTPPPSSSICCNSDVAISTSESVLAAVFHNEWGNVVAIKIATTPATNPMLAEALAVCLATDLAVSLGMTNILFQSDNLSVVKEFEVLTSPVANFRLQSAKGRFMHSCSKFIDWGIIHISRKCNFMAHNVAKWVARNKKMASSSLAIHDLEEGYADISIEGEDDEDLGVDFLVPDDQFYHEIDLERVVEGSPWTFNRQKFVYRRLQRGEDPKKVSRQASTRLRVLIAISRN